MVSSLETQTIVAVAMGSVVARKPVNRKPI